MWFENHGRTIGALKHHPMTQETQARRNRSLNQVFSVILEEIGMFAGKTMRSLIVWMKGDVRKTFPWTKLVMLFEHGPDSYKVSMVKSNPDVRSRAACKKLALPPIRVSVNNPVCPVENGWVANSSSSRSP